MVMLRICKHTFYAYLKIDAIYAFYLESFCVKNLAIWKVFNFSDSAYTRLEGGAHLAGDVREGVGGDVAGDLAREVGECLAGDVGRSDGGQKCQISAATCASSPASTPHHHQRSLSPKLTTRPHDCKTA